MKKVLLGLLMLGIAFTCTMGTAVTVNARPLDAGYRDFQIGSTNDTIWLSGNGIWFATQMQETLNVDAADYTMLYAWDSDPDQLITGYYYDYGIITSSINFRKGIALFKGPVVDLTITFDIAAGTYTTSGTRKEGNIRYEYRGPATIVGTFTVNSVTYPVEGVVTGNYYVTIVEQHTIVK